MSEFKKGDTIINFDENSRNNVSGFYNKTHFTWDYNNNKYNNSNTYQFFVRIKEKNRSVYFSNYFTDNDNIKRTRMVLIEKKLKVNFSYTGIITYFDEE